MQLEGEILLFDQLKLVVSTTVAGTLYGIAFTLFCLYVYALAPRLRGGDRTKQSRFMLACSIVIMLCGLYYLIGDTWSVQDAYIKHSDYPGGAITYIGSTSFGNPLDNVGYLCQLAVHVLTTAIQVWRVWVIWGATRYAILVSLPPLFGLLAYTGIRLRSAILQFMALSWKEMAEQDGKTQIVADGLQGATTILCTLLIALLLIFKHWQQRKLIGSSQGATGYANIVAMIVESYTLESIWLLTLAITMDHPASFFFGSSLIYIEIIAYLLVQYRVASGKSYESQRERQNMSSLRWNHSNHASTRFGETTEIQNTPHVSAIPETTITPGVSSMV